MKNFYRLLNLDSPDATLPEIQQALRNAAQQGTLPIAALRKIRDVLYHAETRRAYNAKLREIEPDFFAAAPKQPAPQKQPASEKQSVFEKQPAPQKQPVSKNSMLIELSGAQFSHLIILYLCGAFSVLLPWVHLGDEPMPGYNVQIIVPLFFLIFAGKLWKDARQKNSIDYITLTLPPLLPPPTSSAFSSATATNYCRNWKPLTWQMPPTWASAFIRRSPCVPPFWRM